MNDDLLFPATQMPDRDWWQALWPDPEGILRAVGIEAGMQVVDLCCGYGHFTVPMCKLVHPSAVYALDIDTDLLNQAEQACRDHENFHAILGDANELSMLLPALVDFVFIANTFHGVPDKTRLSRSVHKQLKPGGRFVVVDWHKRPREATMVLGQPRGPCNEMRITPEDVRNVVEPAGYKLEKVVEVGPYHYGAVFIKNPGS